MSRIRDTYIHDSSGTDIIVDADGRLEVSVGDSTGAEWLLNNGGMPINLHDSAGTPVVLNSGRLPVYMDDRDIDIINSGVVSTDNSTSSLLGAGIAFTGTSEDITNYGTVEVSVYSDVASATDGLSIEFSSDGTNWDHTDVYTVPAATGKNYSIQRVAKFFRIVYTNGAAPQTEFRLQAILNQFYIKPSSHRLSDAITNDDDAELVTTVIKVVGSDPDTYENVDVQHPLPADGDSVYLKDIDVSNSTNGGFSGSVTDYFDSLKTVNSDLTATNPKVIKLWFNRSLQTNAIGFGCDDLAQSFSNIKLEFLGSGEEVRYTEDQSLDSTARNSYVIDLPPLAFNGIRISFVTVNPIGLSNIIIWKSVDVNARLKAQQDDGVISDLSATNSGNLKVSVQEYGDTPSIDAFDRLRVSNAITLFDSKQLHDKQPLFWDESIGGVATSVHSSVNASTVMTVTANAADFVIRQSKQRLNYQPGKSQLVFMTFHSEQIAGLTKRVGLFSGTGANNLTPNNGIFYETDGAISWNIAKNGTTTETATQANWNVDKLDGTGVSGITLDTGATQILVFDYEWLGVGRVRVGFVIDGLIHYCHYFNHANDTSFTNVYMSSPNLPLRYDIQTDGTIGGALDHICSTVMSEGGVDETGVLRSINNGTTHVDANAAGTTYALLGIRLKSAYNDITVTPTNVSVATLTNDNFLWTLQLNPTVAGTFTYSDLTNSALQSASGATANTVTAGTVISGGYVSKGSSDSSDLITALRMGTTIAGVSDELVLCCTPVTSNADILGSFTFRELL